MAELEDSYEVAWFPVGHITPRAARLSAHRDYDAHTNEVCVVVHLPKGVLKLYAKDPEVAKLLREMV